MTPAKAAADAPLYSLPDWEPTATVQGPEFGTLDVMSGHKEKRGKGVLMPPTSYLVLPEGTIGLPLKPISFRASFQTLFKAAGLAGELINDGMGRNTIIRWTPPAKLLESARLLLDPSETTTVTADVSDAFAAAAAAMVAEIDLGAFRDVVLDVLALPATGPMTRHVPYELEDSLEHEMREATPVVAGKMARLITTRFTLDDVSELVDCYVVSGPADSQPIPSGTVTYHHDPEHDETAYRHGYSHRDRNRRLVRPAFVAADEFVEALGINAEIAVVARGDMDAEEADSLPQLLLHADSIHALPSLRALVATGLRLVRPREGAPEQFDTVAKVVVGAFEPWEPVLKGKTASWVPSLRTAVREGRRVVVDATGGEPLGIFSCALDDVPGIVGSSDVVLQYATNLGADDCILPWWASQAATADEYNKNMYELDIEEYRLELAGELLREMRPGPRRPVAEVSTRFQRLANEIEALARPALAEAQALRCPQPVVTAIQNPLEALLAALRAATEVRLLRERRAGEIALAALLAVSIDGQPVADVDEDVA